MQQCSANCTQQTRYLSVFPNVVSCEELETQLTSFLSPAIYWFLPEPGKSPLVSEGRPSWIFFSTIPFLPSHFKWFILLMFSGHQIRSAAMEEDPWIARLDSRVGHDVTYQVDQQNWETRGHKRHHPLHWCEFFFQYKGETIWCQVQQVKEMHSSTVHGHLEWLNRAGTEPQIWDLTSRTGKHQTRFSPTRKPCVEAYRGWQRIDPSAMDQYSLSQWCPRAMETEVINTFSSHPLHSSVAFLISPGL